MRKILIGAAVAAAAFAAMPAAAQYPGYERGYGNERGYGYESQHAGRTFSDELGRIAQRIRMLASQRRVSPREADRLLDEVGRLDRLSNRYRRDGVTQWEHRDLQQRLAQLRERSRFAMAGGWNERRWDDGRWNADGRYEGEDDDRWDRDDDEDDDRWDRDDDDDDDGERWDDRPDA